MKNLKLFIFTIVIFSNYNSFGQYYITGLTSGLKDSSMVLLRNMDLDSPFDTALVINNTFEFKGEVEGCNKFWIRSIPYSNANSRFFFVENTKITIDSRGRLFSDAIIRGGKLQEQNYQLDIFLDKSKSFFEVLDQKSEFIKMHPDYEYCAYMLEDMKLNMKNADVQNLFDLLTEDVKNSRWGYSIKNYLGKSKDFNVGDKYVDFKLKDINNKIVSISSFDGKVFLLDFWGSWCGSCRIEHPRFLELYEKYKNKGFEIISVSLDKDLNKWIKAVKDDGLTWTNACETEGLNSDVAVTYKTYTVPHNLLFDSNGKFIAKNLNGEALGNRLKMIFGE